jgi:hypothetical protein
LMDAIADRMSALPDQRVKCTGATIGANRYHRRIPQERAI